MAPRAPWAPPSPASCVGADPASRSHYLRAKGTVEAAYQALGFERLSFFRPSLLVTREARYGLPDRLTQLVFPRLSWMLPSRYHEIPIEDLARAMRRNAERQATAPVEVLHCGEMMILLQSAARL